MIEDIATLDTMLADSFPKEINKAKIREIFEILQTQERSDWGNEELGADQELWREKFTSSGWRRKDWFFFTNQPGPTNRDVEENSRKVGYKESHHC